MNEFQSLFGINKSEIKRTCVLMPFIKRNILDHFGVRVLSRGKLFGTAHTEYFTLIHTGLGPTFLGDACLYLNQTKCKTAILFGSCGLVESKDLSIGSIVSPVKCYESEGFTETLTFNKSQSKCFTPDKPLYDAFINFDHNKNIVHKATCATIGSLKLEKDYKYIFIRKCIDIVDMECSSLFSACQLAGIRSFAVMYVSDIIGKKPFYKNLSFKDKLSVDNAIKTSSDLIWKFTKALSNA